MKRSNLIAGAAGLALAGALYPFVRPRKPYSFRDKVVLITGGSRGLGLLMARELAAEGAKLALLARSEAELRRAAHELRSRGGRVLELPADVGEKEQVEAAVDRVLTYYGGLDVLINNAGIIQVGPVQHMGMEDYEVAMRVHFWGPLYAIQAALPQMRRQGGGRIVTVSSIGGKVAVPHLVPYSSSKFALVGLSDGMRAELAKENVTVTTVCPWLVRTGSYRNVALKGRHAQELTWFALGDSLPFVSMDAREAARRILKACRRGEARLVPGPGRVAVAADALFPQFTAAMMKVMDRLLPAPTGAAGDVPHTGWERPSALAPSLLTTLSDRAAARNNQVGDQFPSS